MFTYTCCNSLRQEEKNQTRHIIYVISQHIFELNPLNEEFQQDLKKILAEKTSESSKTCSAPEMVGQQIFTLQLVMLHSKS